MRLRRQSALYIDGKYKGYATGAGTYTVRRLKLEGGRKYTFYAVDECGTTSWGPSRYRMKSSWATFTWTLTCTGGGITPTTGSWTGTTSRGQPMSFEVISGGTQYQNFKVKTDFDFGSCYGTTETTVTSPGSISNGSFGSTGGTFGFTGQFSSATSATGTYQFSGLYIYPCGYLYQTGTWSANWTSSSLADGAESVTAAPEHPGRHNKVTIEYLEPSPREVKDVLTREWDELVTHHKRVVRRDFEAALARYNLENPMEGTPILARSLSSRSAKGAMVSPTSRHIPCEDCASVRLSH
ncbi:MAG: hypothetical protein HYX75_00640 [Acidobacteria bacterium]|nr:hypothetical protein [Acidobacteriota bacterium]